MKFHIDIDCTPEEARQFFGLPDVAPIQDAMMQRVQERLEENIQNMDPETLMKTWLPVTMQGWQDLQKMWMSQMGAMGGTDTGSDKDSG